MFLCKLVSNNLRCAHENLIYYTNPRRKSVSADVRNIDKILIANRGEIACRVIRTAKRLGLRTVGVYSEVDKDALHVSMADEAHFIGPAPPTESYLRGDKLLGVAKSSKCQAIHPGYGFLSENAEFAESCQKEDIIFIGPPASAIRDMGIKSTSKGIMSAAGVPVIKGYHGEDQTNDRLKNEAEIIGFPIMIKAVRGGGGKGMRIAYSPADFEENLESARREAHKAFGNSEVLLEKFIVHPRHIEVQVFADVHGNVVHLYERDCSVQRRHQKIIEEAPAPGLSGKLRHQLGEAAVRAAKAVGYVGAGTVEFILDKNDHTFNFMEMNTRLQVEHPVTEMITGFDLVEWQIKVASGEKLPVSQEDIPLIGHSFEARIYAENPNEGFLPGAGLLTHLSCPSPSGDVRIETGVREGDEVSVHYDPMIAKLVVRGQDRLEALSKLQANLREYNIAGLETNINFLLNLSRHPEFSSGNVHTNFIRDQEASLFAKVAPTDAQLFQASLAIIQKDRMDERNVAISRNDRYNPFLIESNFRINHRCIKDVRLTYEGKEFFVKVEYVDKNEYRMSRDGGKTWKVVRGNVTRRGNGLVLNCDIGEVKTRVNVFKCDRFVAIFDQNGKIQFSLNVPDYEEHTESSVESNSAITPMPGVLDKVLVKPGDVVKKGDALFVLIAMKMEHIVRSTKDARVASVFSRQGESVPKDAVIVQFEK